MQKQKNIQLIVIGILAFAVLFMSIGFAAYSQVLNINGMATVGSGNKWSVHFNPNTYQLGEGSVKPTALEFTDNSVDFAAHLEKPGDYYLFSVKAANNGNYDGILDNVWMTTPDAKLEPLVDYTVYYNNEYTFTSSKFNLNYAVNKNAGMDTKSIVVKVLYNPDEGAEIPAEGVDFDFNLTLDFVQSV